MTDVSTSGWDVVSVTDLDTMNAIINSDKLYPPEFSASDSFLGTEINLAGTWGGWEISNNASGGKINIRCDISKGSVKYNGKEVNVNDKSNASWVEIEVLLKGIQASPEEWVSGDDKIAEDTRCHQLMIDTNNTIVVTEHHFTGPDMGKDGLSSVIPDLFNEWFNDNVGKFRQIFSVILIGLEAGNSEFKWLYPSAYSYAANSSIDGNTTGFGVLSLIDGKTDIGSLQQSIDIQALNLVRTFGANLALIISKSMFIKHILLPAAISLVKGSTEGDFTFTDTGLSLKNNREIVWQDFDDGKGGTFSPILPKGGFILSLQADAITLSIMGAHYRPNAMCTVFMGVEQRFRYKVEKNSSGEPVFVPDESGLGDAVISCSVKIDEWVSAFEITMGIITAIGTIIGLGTLAIDAIATRAAATLVMEEAAEFTVFSVNTAEIGELTAAELEGISNAILRGVVSNPTILSAVKIGSVVMGTLSGLALSGAMISAAIYNDKFDDVPSFHTFASAITGSTVWPGIKNTELKSASLADSFVIGLELK